MWMTSLVCKTVLISGKMYGVKNTSKASLTSWCKTKNYLKSLIARVCCYLSWGEHANDVANDQLCKLLESGTGFRTFPAFQPYLARLREVSRICQLIPEMVYEICGKGRLIEVKECRRHTGKREDPGIWGSFGRCYILIEKDRRVIRSYT